MLLQDYARDAKIVSKKECADLYKKAYLGDEEAKQKLWNSTILLALKISKKYENRIFEIPDLMAVCYEAFVKSIESGIYDIEKGAWTTWMWNRFWGAIRRAIDNECRIVRIPAASFYKYHPKLVEMQLDESLGEELLACNSNLELEEESVLNLLNYDSLTKMQVYVLVQYYLCSRTLKDLAKELGCTKQCISQQKQIALYKLRRDNMKYADRIAS